MRAPGMDAPEPDPQAAQAEFAATLYGELRAIAARELRGRAQGTIGVSALVNEAYLRLERSGATRGGRDSVLAQASKAMRSVLVDYARRRNALKRGEGQRAPLESGICIALDDRTAYDVLLVEDALQHMAKQQPELAEAAAMRFFGELTIQETARATGMSTRRVKLASAYLRDLLSEA